MLPTITKMLYLEQSRGGMTIVGSRDFIPPLPPDAPGTATIAALFVATGEGISFCFMLGRQGAWASLCVPVSELIEKFRDTLEYDPDLRLTPEFFEGTRWILAKVSDYRTYFYLMVGPDSGVIIHAGDETAECLQQKIVPRLDGAYLNSWRDLLGATFGLPPLRSLAASSGAQVPWKF